MSFNFGTPSSAPATTSSGGFTFGANKPTGFGSPATTQAGSLFGPPATNALTAFGSSPATAFGSTPAPAFSTGTTFGGFGTSVPSSAPNAGLTFGGTTSLAPTNLNFTTPATSTATAASGGLGGFNFNPATSATAITTQTGVSGSLFGGTSTTAGGPFGATVTPSIGLGGADPSKSVSGNAAANTTANAGNTEQQPRNTKLPNEIMQTVQSFQEFVKKQKALSSDVMRASIKPLHKVNADIEALRRDIVAADGCMRVARTQSRRLRSACAKTLAAAEAAQRTYETPPGLQYENAAPPQYMMELLVELELQLQSLKRQMEEASRHMQAAPKALSQQELQQGMRRMHESFVAVAGRLQSVHAQVEAQKEQYLALRRNVLKDPTDVFQQRPKSSKMGKLEQVLNSTHTQATSAVLADPRLALAPRQISGPTPFGLDASDSPFGLAAAALHSTVLGSSWSQTPRAAINTNLAISNINTGSFGTTGTSNTTGTGGFNTGGTGVTCFGAIRFNTSLTSTGNTSSVGEAETFQLQKPPKKSRH